MNALIPKDFFELKASNQEYWQLLKAQIEKDFQRINNEELDLNLLSTNDWITQIASRCNALDKTNQLENLLYLIDLPENWSANLKLSDNYFTDLAQAIIQREWAKIYFRLNY